MTRNDEDSYGALKDRFGAALQQAEAGRLHSPTAAPRAKRIRVLRVVGGAAVVAVAASVAVLAIGTSPPAQRLDVAAAAQAALAPEPGIQHLRLKTTTDYRLDGKPMVFKAGMAPPAGPSLVERWATAELGTFRQITTETDASGAPVSRYEQAQRAGPTGKRDDVAKSYYGRDRSMEIITRIPKGLRKYDTGGFHWGPRGDERLEDLRAMLASGQIEDRGLAAIDGRRTRRLVGEKTFPGEPPLTFEYYVDADTFAPVRMVQVWRVRLDGEPAQNGGKLQTTTDTIDFVVYEHLPATEDNEKLLDFTPPAGTKITSRRYREGPRDATKRHERDGLDPEEIAEGAGATN